MNASGRPLTLEDPDGRFARVCVECDSVSITMPTNVITDRSYYALQQPYDIRTRLAIHQYWDQRNAGPYRLSILVPYGTENTIAAIQGAVGGQARGETGTTSPNTPTDGRSPNNRMWYSYGSDRVAAHEVGHMLGVRGPCNNHDCDPNGLMAAGLSSGAEIPRWYVDQILNKAGLTGRRCGCGTISP